MDVLAIFIFVVWFWLLITVFADSQIGDSGEVSSLMVGASHLLRVPLSAGGALECWGFRLMPSMAGKEESRPHC